MADASGTLFQSQGLRAVELGPGDVTALQRFYEANPAYFLAVTGLAPAADEAWRELHEEPPPDLTFGRVWRLGVVDEAGELVAMASVASDFLAERVWLLGFFIVASSLHGTGTSLALHEALEAWMRGNGAHWIRLAVVVGNVRAERFWERVGYREVRRRDGEEMGERVNSVRIMVKPLAGGDPAEYLALVAHDRADEA